MSLTVAALIVLAVGGLMSLVVCTKSRWAACTLGPAAAVAGCLLALVQAIEVLAGGEAVALQLAWSVPFGSFSLGMDPLSAVFAVPVAVVGALAAVYGSRYLHDSAPRKVAASWCSYNLLLAAMLMIVTARNGVLFLLAWEGMSLASFFLVMFDSEQASVRRAGWTYLVASHLGTAFLLAMFALLARGSGSFDFAALGADAGMASVVFLAAMIGFGTKAGFVPLHVWLPEAHPAAPSHVSAVMSGVMLKMGIYGLLRTLTLLSLPPAWWGWLLLSVGATSGVLGVLFALAQHDVKRLLAYSSVENIGIIALGLGIGLLGISYGNAAMAVLGLAGGLLHVVNHAAFKSLLFLGAGAAAHATGTREIDHLGGLMKNMPVTGATFLVGSAAISGLPPLNGFVSELLIYLAAFSALTGAVGSVAGPLAGALVAGSLALIGGLAAACFAKATGVIFLGEPRTAHAAGAHGAGAAMRWPMLVLAGVCVAIGLLGWLALRVLAPAVESLVPAEMAEEFSIGLVTGETALQCIAAGGAALWLAVGLLAFLRKRLLAGRQVGAAGTWDCGYAAPTPRMQYTSSSFARPIIVFFRFFLRTRDAVHAPQGLFPARADLHTETPDVFRESGFAPAFAAVRWVAMKARWLQQGRIQLYVLYIALTLLVLLVWKLG